MGHSHLSCLGDRFADTGERLGKIERVVEPVENAADGRHFGSVARMAEDWAVPAARRADNRAIGGKGVGEPVLSRSQPDHRRVDVQPQVEHRLSISQHELHGDAGLVHERLADQLGTNVRQQCAAVENLLDPVWLNGRAETEFQRPAPEVRDQVTAGVTARFLHHRQKAQAQRGSGSRFGHTGFLARRDRPIRDSGKKWERL